ncbi:MAG: PhoPQ-activated protein PqaA family protein, partial [Verrucomicrobiota bacterium]
MIARFTNNIETQLRRLLLLAFVAATFVACSKPETKVVAKADVVAGSRKSPKAPDERTALDEYIAAPDTNYTYRVVKTVPGKDQTTFIVDMTSQAWLTTKEVDHPLWKHWVIIVKPNEVASSKSLLFISGGGNGGEPPDSASPNLIEIALATKSVVTELKMVPNQPLVFAGEIEGRKEDSLIAYTWDKFLRTGDKKWPARLPMTKSAVRAMDTVTSVLGSPEGGKTKIDGFVVAGGSKRGWTTWTTAAVDKRVVAVVPLVIDVLNMEPSMLHHYAAYGFWAPSVGNYTAFH